MTIIDLLKKAFEQGCCYEATLSKAYSFRNFMKENENHLWNEYSWGNIESRPPKAGRYLIYRKKCNKIHFEQWNGSGWASSNRDCTHWAEIMPPK